MIDRVRHSEKNRNQDLLDDFLMQDRRFVYAEMSGARDMRHVLVVDDPLETRSADDRDTGA